MVGTAEIKSALAALFTGRQGCRGCPEKGAPDGAACREMATSARATVRPARKAPLPRHFPHPLPTCVSGEDDARGPLPGRPLPAGPRAGDDQDGPCRRMLFFSVGALRSTSWKVCGPDLCCRRDAAPACPSITYANTDRKSLPAAPAVARPDSRHGGRSLARRRAPAVY